MKLKEKGMTAEIPTASMADIAFLLIIFFMVTTVFSATKGLDFKLPKEDQNLPPSEEEAVYIKVNPDASISVDGKLMSLENILPYLQPKLQRWPDKPIILHTDPEAPYSAMVAVYDVLTQGEKVIGIKVKNVSIPTSSEIQEYIATFGYNPFEVGFSQ
ncbi:MAG: biopolymer transporter ExbD [Acidobacteriota bacterium]